MKSQHRISSFLANPVIPGLYVWAVTVAPPSLLDGAGVGARICAVLALGACVAGGGLAASSPVWSRRLGIHGFVGASVASWLLVGPNSPGGGLTRSVLGTLGWLAFAFGWGVVRKVGTIPEEHPAALPGEPLRARGALHFRAPVALALALIGASLCLLLPWRIDRMPHAALGHIVGLVTAGGLLIGAGRLATSPSVGGVSVAQPARRLQNALGPLLLLVCLVVFGLIQAWWVGG